MESKLLILVTVFDIHAKCLRYYVVNMDIDSQWEYYLEPEIEKIYRSYIIALTDFKYDIVGVKIINGVYLDDNKKDNGYVESKEVKEKRDPILRKNKKTIGRLKPIYKKM